MIKGVTENELKIIKEILFRYPYEFYLYGSRVKGDFTKSSDLDILIKADDKIPFEKIEELETAFNNSLIPYIFNFIDFNKISDEFYQLIKESLVKI